MRFEKWFPPCLALTCLVVAALYWEMGAYVASNPFGRPWYQEWYMGVVGMEACTVLAFLVMRAWLEALRVERQYRRSIA